MPISIKPIEPDHLPAVIELMREFAAYEGLSDYCEITVERLAAAMFDDGSFVEGLAALAEEKLIGYALFFPSFASFRGECGLYLEDIYVQQAYRRDGVGIKLLKEIARSAGSRGMERIDFQVLSWNEPALTFYRKHGAVSNDDETHFKFSGGAFRILAE
jgi:GNAT superfamily N-acetyltransferase